jgi:ribosomal protein S18 acetylase RimI-like enzyme
MSAPSLSILRFHSRPIQLDSSSTEPPMKFQCDPYLASLLRSVPIDAKTDLTPPDGSIEAGAVTYVLVESTDVQRKCMCDGLTHGQLAAPVVIFCADDLEMTRSDVALCPRCVLLPERAAAKEASTSGGSKMLNPVLAYCQFGFVRTTSGCRSEAYLVSVVVSREHRGKGLCKLMLTHSMADFCSAVAPPTLQRIKLHTSSDLQRLVEMYKTRFGFAVRRTAKGYYRKPIVRDGVEMEASPKSFLLAQFQQKEAAAKRASQKQRRNREEGDDEDDER